MTSILVTEKYYILKFIPHIRTEQILITLLFSQIDRREEVIIIIIL
jgi:hypothetical protein